MKSLINILSLFVCCSLLLLYSCGTSDTDIPTTAPDTEITIVTRAGGEDVIGESALYNLWLVVYNEQGTQIEYCQNLLTAPADDAISVTRVLTNHLTTGKKKFVAIGNKPDSWTLDKATNTPTLANLMNFKWQQSDLPALEKTGTDTYYQDANGRFKIDKNKPMRFSGYQEFEILPDVPNRIRLSLLRAVGKLVVEFIPDWKGRGSAEVDKIDEIDFSKEVGITNPVVVKVRNRAKTSSLLEGDKKIDPISDLTWIETTAEEVYGYKDKNGDMILNYDTSVTPAVPLKTIKTIPAYFFENHPGFDDSTDPTVWETYNKTKHPLMDIKVNTDARENPPLTDVQFGDRLVENEKVEVRGIFRNHYYHLTIKVFIDPTALYIILSVQDWSDVIPTDPIPPIEIPY